MNINLLLPFRLKEAGSEVRAERTLAVEYYRGFRMGIDSAVAMGLNVKLTTLDTRDNEHYLQQLISEGKLGDADVLIGPVFPKGLKVLSSYSEGRKIPVVSPLAATDPAQFNNRYLLSFTGDINVHAKRLVQYVKSTAAKPGSKVVIINRKNKEDAALADALTAELKAQGMEYVEYASVYELERHITPGNRYVVMVTAYDAAFIDGTVRKLAQMQIKGNAKGYILTGHPNWAKLQLPMNMMAALNTVITSGYNVNYGNAATDRFLKKYRQVNKSEPGEYAIKGFDEGLYLGQLMLKNGSNFTAALPGTPYKGLHNNFTFNNEGERGYVNTSVRLVKYAEDGPKVIN